MNEIIIRNLSEELMEETVKFISSCQSVDESFIAWLGYSPEEIKSQLMDLTPSFKERCLIAIDRGAVCGFLGIYVSEEQSTLRLLGPYVSMKNSWTEIAVNLLSALKEKIPAHIKMAKVAFYDANVNCKRMYETNYFTLYNAEKTLILNNKSLISPLKLINQKINIRYYQSGDFNDFIRIHPTTAYFTGSEVVSRLNPYNQLIVAKLDNRVIGYVYFEMLVSDGYAEICFVNVSPEFRSRGIGSVLINQVITEVFKYNWVKHIQISVRVNNEAAERLYTRIGFKEKNVIIALQRDLNVCPLGEFI
ncbi:GNAT family N-acetyltransferase [Alkaliphilus sp. MSJ-5]|uniref:GNAT family N-acetyltransferase n=1 Tax=Alkaliphilus flagellatus TaxID=2841507 RepID=A0ABS6G160_9FIRM|nr:GNAT family N-acetyltransferase [Alkaliphilus flagellatus]MBU5675467.1 GNAT family N-acetyltransferase [Alkaliphilus flagellatus]